MNRGERLVEKFSETERGKFEYEASERGFAANIGSMEVEARESWGLAEEITLSSGTCTSHPISTSETDDDDDDDDGES